MHELMTILLGSTAIAAGLAMIALATRWLAKPAVTHAIWLLVLVRLVTPPIVRVNTWRNGSTPAVREAAVETVDSEATAMPAAGGWVVDSKDWRDRTPARMAVTGTVAAPVPGDRSRSPEVRSSDGDGKVLGMRWISLPLIVLMGWGAGSLVYAIVIAWRVTRFCGLLKQVAPAGAEADAIVADVARAMGIRQAPDVRVVKAILSPMMFALRRAVLVLPTSVVERLSPQQQRAIVAHELAHLRRRDHWVRWFELFATTLLWWHPLLWLARRGLHEAEEQCCDAWVVALMKGQAEGRKTYADALVDVLEMTCLAGARKLPVGASGLGAMTNLKRRLIMILADDDRTPAKSMSRVARIAVVVIAAALLPLAPVRGEERKKSDPPSSDATTTTPAVAAVEESTHKAVQSLLEAAQDPDESVRNAARDAIVRFGPKGVPVLIEAMANEKTAELAMQLLPAIGIEAAEALIQSLDSPSATPATRERAMVTLRQMIASNVPPGGGFAGGMGGPPGAPVAFGAAAAPGAIGPEGGGGNGMFNPTAQPWALNVAEWSIPPATRASTDSNVAVRRAAIQLLGTAAQWIPDPALAKPLTAALKDKDASVRLLAAQSLLPLVRAVPGMPAALAGAAQDSDAVVRIAALNALASLGHGAREAMPVVTSALRDSNPQVRVAAANALGAMQAPVPPPSSQESFGGGNGTNITWLAHAVTNVWHWNKLGRDDLAGESAKKIIEAQPPPEMLLNVVAQEASARNEDLNNWLKRASEVKELKDLVATLNKAVQSPPPAGAEPPK